MKDTNGCILQSLAGLLLLLVLVAFSVAHETFAQERTVVNYPYGCVPDSTLRISFFAVNAPDPVRCRAANFNDAHFYGEADFNDAHFDSVANFRAAQFDGMAYFSTAQFNSMAYFNGAQFDGEAFFFGSQFDGLASFDRAHFDGLASSFDEAQFDGMAYFGGAQFGSEVSFVDAHFDGMVYFGGAHFDGLADFRGASFKDYVDFTNAFLPESLDLRYVTDIAEDINLTYARLDTLKTYKSKIALFGSDISKIVINSDLFELWFTIDETRDQRKSVYEQVLKKLDDEGLRDSYEDFDIEYQAFKYKRTSWGHVINFLQRLWWNYGYNKEWVFWWSAAWLALFSAFNTWNADTLQKTYKVEKFGAGPTPLSPFPRFFLAFAYTNVIFFGLKMSLDKFRAPTTGKEFWLMAYIFFIYVVGLWHTGFIVNIIFG